MITLIMAIIIKCHEQFIIYLNDQSLPNGLNLNIITITLYRHNNFFFIFYIFPMNLKKRIYDSYDNSYTIYIYIYIQYIYIYKYI